MLESALAQNLGVPRSELRKHREKYPDFTYKEGRLIHWTGEGTEWVHKWYGVGARGHELPPDTYPATVNRADFPNRKLIQAKVDSPEVGDYVLVRVRNAQMFVPGMEIEVRRDGNGWVVIRQPRQRGKM